MKQTHATTNNLDTFAESDVSANLITHNLTVVGGRQSGAQVPIQFGTSISVGTGIDNDVVLFSESSEPCRFLLESQGYVLLLRVLEGRIEHGEAMLESNAVHLVQNVDQFGMGETRFVVAVAPNPSQHPKVERVREASADGLHSKSGREPGKESWRGKLVSLMAARPLVIASLSLGTLLLLSVVSSGLVRAFNDRNQAPGFEQRLAATGLQQVRYIPSDGAQPGRIVGAVASHDQQRQVQELVKRYGGALDVSLQVNEALSASIEDLYRVNGVRAQVTVTGLGEVSVWSATNDLELLDLIENRLKTDFPNVVSMTRANAAPIEKVVVADEGQVAMTDPDKQVTLVVAGENGYLMTKDKSRYFVGSLLPSGHQVIRIENGNVYVQSDGEVVRLEF